MVAWVLISILAVLVILGILMIFAVKGKRRPTDYYAFFVIGLIWTIFGALNMFFREGASVIFFIMGLVFLAIGLGHKKDWEKNRRTWKDMDKRERNVMVITIVLLGALVLAGIIAYLIVGGYL